MDATSLLREAYGPLIALADRMDDDLGWTATALPGWCVRDLVFHLLCDAQRALVALATPADGRADTDEVSYWTHWQPGGADAAKGLRAVRISASVWTSARGPAGLYAETARAVLTAAAGARPSEVITTQGHALTVDALVRTLAVEAAVHHLDLVSVLPDPPAPAVRAEARRVLDALGGGPAPASWTDEHYLRAGTGRIALTDADRAELGERATRYPLFG